MDNSNNRSKVSISNFAYLKITESRANQVIYKENTRLFDGWWCKTSDGLRLLLPGIHLVNSVTSYSVSRCTTTTCFAYQDDMAKIPGSCVPYSNVNWTLSLSFTFVVHKPTSHTHLKIIEEKDTKMGKSSQKMNLTGQTWQFTRNMHKYISLR